MTTKGSAVPASRRSGIRTRSARGSRLWTGFLCGAAIFALATSPLEAQELRISFSQGISGVNEVGFPRGYGGGARVFFFRGLGLAVEHDRMTASPRVWGFTCPPGVPAGDDCDEERVAIDADLRVTSFLFMLRAQGDEWGIRLGIGRSAGVVTGTGVGVESGRAVPLPPADEGAGTWGWSQGSDGSVFVIEFLRRLPLPGPFPLSGQLAYRRHHTEMSGCEVGEYSPYCGRHALTELQAGLNLGLWPFR